MTWRTASDIAIIQQQVRTFIVDNFLFGEDQPFAAQESFLQTNLIDSTGILELIQYLEQVYEIHISDNEMVPENLDSLDNIAAFIMRKTGG